MGHQAELTCTLDADDVLIDFSSGWNTFAEENRGPGALRETLLGTSFWSSVSGQPVRQRLAQILEICRSSGATCQMAYRCDSSQMRRLHRLRIEPLSGGAC